MIDQDAIERRERVFAQLRQAQEESKKLDEEFEIIHNQMREMRETGHKKRREAEKLSRLIQVMIMHDCCPVEAQLRYPEELEDRDEVMESNSTGPQQAVKGRYIGEASSLNKAYI